MKTIILNTVEQMIDSDMIFRCYKIDMQDVVNTLYNILDGDSVLISQMKQPLNSRHDVFASFCQKLEDAILELIDPDKGDECMLKYNLMRDDYMFYDKWRKELFNKMYNEYKVTG